MQLTMENAVSSSATAFESILKPHHAPHMPRTPSRRQQFTDDEVKPLLADLSPAATLDILMSTNPVQTDKDHRRSFIKAGVENASESERAWGIRAALLGKKIRAWLEELQAWAWTDGTQQETCNDFEEAWSRKRIDAYMRRIETIRDDMKTLQVEDLKDHVRKAHQRSHNTTHGYEGLDDFTAIITATIVQSLPPLLQLDGLLKAWSTRLFILRQGPAFLQELEGCKESLKSSWMTIVQNEGGELRPKTGLTKQAALAIQAVLQDQIAHLGQRIDRMLDLLEGSQDTLPDQWIDAVDQLESDYSLWVVKAEELAWDNHLQSSAQEDNDTTARMEDTLDEANILLRDREASLDELLFTDGRDLDGAKESRIVKPFHSSIPLTNYSSEPSNTSTSPGVGSELSRPDSSLSGPSSGRSSAEIMRASIATNPGSPMKVMTPIRQSFQSARLPQIGDVKSKDIRRLLVRRSESCPSAIPLASPETFRRRSIRPTALVRENTETEDTEVAAGQTQVTAGAIEETIQPLGASDSYFPTPPSPDKPKSRFENHEDFEPGSAPIKVQRQRSTKVADPSPHNVPPPSTFRTKQHKDKLEARISTILHDIPADIRLKSSGAKTPPPGAVPNLSRPKTPLRRSITPQLLRKARTPMTCPSLTLAPATEPGPKSFNRSINEPEIKLYHLHQNSPNPSSGKEQTPVKLYVRLVGVDGERVMVRVGGGWADLGEYLREYAAHHGATSGKRSGSDFVVQNLPTPGSASTANGTPKSCPGSGPGSQPGNRSGWEGEEPPSPSPVLPNGSLGLAGPRSRDVSTGNVQQAMVDDVVKHVHGTASGGGVGKVGGIKRVFLRRRGTLGEKG